MADNIKVIADRSEIVAIADAVRSKLNTTNQMTLGEIATNISNISGSGSSGGSTSGGINTSDATATESDLTEGTTAYVKGRKITGVNPYRMEETTQEVDTQTELIEQILQDLEGKAASGSGSATSGGYQIKSGTTTSATIQTGLSSIKEFFIYKESITATGLIHLHYNESGTSYLYASAWSTNNYGTKTITNGTNRATVNGGTLTLPSTSATSGGLTSGVTYKWIAIGE